MHTFKPGLYASLLLAAASLSIVAGLTQITTKAEAKAAPVAVVEVAPAVKAPLPKFQVTDLSHTPPAVAPWNSPGMWSVIETGRSTIRCLYSDEQIKINVKAAEHGGGMDGMLCITNRKDDWMNLIHLPKNVISNINWDVRGFIEVEFTLQDNSKYFAHYFVTPLRSDKDMMKVARMEGFKNFGDMVAGSKHIKITASTNDGTFVQNFQNRILD